MAVANPLESGSLTNSDMVPNLDSNAEDDNVSCDIESIFSTESIPSSQSSLGETFSSALAEFTNLLLFDDELMLLYPTAILKLGPDKFQRNFARFLKRYGQRLGSEASDELQRRAAHFVRVSARRTATEMGRILRQEGQELLGEFRLESELSKAAQLNAWLESQKGVRQQQYSKVSFGAAAETIDEYGLSGDNDSDDSDKSEQNPFHTIDEVKEFMVSARAMSSLREEFRIWLKADRRNGSKRPTEKTEDKEKVEIQEDYQMSYRCITEFQGEICLHR
jgi:hypothetical protein